MGVLDKDREFQAAENAKARAFEVEMLGRQNALNIEQWERENEYNLPANQLARLKAAGLNPDLAYGQLGSSGLVAARSPEMRMDADYHPVDAAATSQAKTQRINAILQTAQQANQIIRSAFENRNIEAQTRGIEIDNQLKAPKVPLAADVADWELKNVRKDWYVKDSQQAKNFSDANKANNEAAYVKTMEAVERLKGVKLEKQKPYFDMVAKYEAATTQGQYILTIGNIFNVVSDGELKQAQKAYWEKNKEMLEKQITYQDYLNEMEKMRKDLLGVVHGNITKDPTYFNTMQRIQALTSALGSIFGGAGTSIINSALNH